MKLTNGDLTIANASQCQAKHKSKIPDPTCKHAIITDKVGMPYVCTFVAS
jgi:hypothetical protein